MAESTSESKDGAAEAEEARRSPWPLLAPALTFVGGLLLGATVVGASNLGEEDPDARATATPTVTVTSTPERTERELVVRVPTACLDIADEASAARARVEAAAAAARDLDARRLREHLDALQTLQRHVETLAEQCKQRVETQTVGPS